MDGIKKMLFYAQDYKGKFYLSIVLIALSVICDIIPYVLVYFLVKGFILSSITYETVIALSAGIFVALLFKNYLFIKGTDFSHQVAYNALKNIRKSFSEKMMKQPMGAIQKKGSGAYKKNLVEDIDSIEMLMAHLIPEGIPYALSPLVAIGTLLVMDWRLALLALGSIPIGLFSIVVMMGTGKKKMSVFLAAEEGMNKTIVDYISGMEVIKIFNRTTDSFEKFKTNIENYRKYAMDWLNDSWTYMALCAAVLPCTIILLLPVGLKFYLAGSLDLSTYIFALLLTMSMSIPLVKLVNYIPTIPIVGFKINQIEGVFSDEEVYYSNKDLVPDNYDIVYDNVSFAYEKKETVKCVNFTAQENTITAIVGGSGSGKSTLAKLLVKFWDVNQGKITIGGINISDIAMDKLMELVSFVDQDTFLFNMPIMENIRLGNPEATDEQVMEAAKLAQCHEFIAALDNGYQTMPGDVGSKLSGGESQRITIARAILKDAPIIILDEATSSSDSENEDKIQEALNGLIAGKTLIVIAHRLSTIAHVDNIILLEHGEIKGMGTHERLLAASAEYKNLWDTHMRSMDWQFQIDKEGEVGKHA